MKRILFTLLLSFSFIATNAQVVEMYGGGYISDNAVMDKIDIKEIGRSIHVATVEDGSLVVRRFYRGKWEEFDKTPISGIFKLKTVKLFAYKAVPYVFCLYDGKMSVIRAIDDKWEFVGEEEFGEGSIEDPEFSVIGENPYIIYEDRDYEMLRMVSLLDESWYDVDLISMETVKSYRLAANIRGDIYLSILDDEGIMIKKVDQEIENISDWSDLMKKEKIDNTFAIDDFEFIGNKGYISYTDSDNTIVIMTLIDLEKKWEIIEESKDPIQMGKKNYNLNISEYYYFISLSEGGIPQYLKNNAKGVWGDITNLSTKKARAVASTEYRNVIYVAYVDSATGKLMVKKIEKGLNEDENEDSKTKTKTKGKKKK